MRAAITTDGKGVYPHFGLCPLFAIVEIRDGKELSRQYVENPGHNPGFLPQFLDRRGIHLLLTGGIGQRALRMFEEMGIETILGVSGGIEAVVESILRGTVEGGENLCTKEWADSNHQVPDKPIRRREYEPVPR